MQKSVIEYLQSTVSRFPAKIAVKDSEMSITFGDLLDAVVGKRIAER